MSNSFSQDNIQINEKTSEEPLFKNKLLMQSFQQTENNKTETANSLDEKKAADENNKKLRDELNKALEKRNLLDDKIQNEQNNLVKLSQKQEKGDYIFIIYIKHILGFKIKMILQKKLKKNMIKIIKPQIKRKKTKLSQQKKTIKLEF